MGFSSSWALPATPSPPLNSVPSPTCQAFFQTGPSREPGSQGPCLCHSKLDWPLLITS
jgi:hypothetical protein